MLADPLVRSLSGLNDFFNVVSLAVKKGSDWYADQSFGLLQLKGLGLINAKMFFLIFIAVGWSSGSSNGSV